MIHLNLKTKPIIYTCHLCGCIIEDANERERISFSHMYFEKNFARYAERKYKSITVCKDCVAKVKKQLNVEEETTGV